MYNIKTILRNVFVFVVCLLPYTSVYAAADSIATHNPSTGDTSGRFIWIVMAVGAIALVTIIAMLIASRRKK